MPTAISGVEQRLLLLLKPPPWSRSLASMRKSRDRSTAPSHKTRSLPRNWGLIRIQKLWNRRFASLGAGYLECCLVWLCLRWPCSSDWALLEAHVTALLLQTHHLQLPLHLLLQLQLRLQLMEARSQALHRLQFPLFPPMPILPQTLQQRLLLAPLQSRPFLTSRADRTQLRPQLQLQPQQLPQLSAPLQLPQSQFLQWW